MRSSDKLRLFNVGLIVFLLFVYGSIAIGLYKLGYSNACRAYEKEINKYWCRKYIDEELGK